MIIQTSLKRENSLKITSEQIKEKFQDERFKGNCFRLDQKDISVQQVKAFVREIFTQEENKNKKKAEETYDPRKNRLQHGIVFILDNIERYQYRIQR